MRGGISQYLNGVSRMLYGRSLQPEEYASKLFRGMRQLPGMTNRLSPGAADQAARLVGGIHRLMRPLQGTHTERATRRYRDFVRAFPERMSEGLMNPSASARDRSWAMGRLGRGAELYKDINRSTWLDHWK